MTGVILIESMTELPDAMILEAIQADCRHSSRRFLRMAITAACAVMMIGVFWLGKGTVAEIPEATDFLSEPVSDVDTMYPLSRQELRESSYGAFCPDFLQEDGVLLEAAVYGDCVMKADFSYSGGIVMVYVAPRGWNSYYEARILDLNAVELESGTTIMGPIFLEEQFTPQCQTYVEEWETIQGLEQRKFGVATKDYIVLYQLSSNDMDWITKVFEGISDCYNRK